MRYMLHISRAVGTLGGGGGQCMHGVPRILADKGQIMLATLLFAPKFHMYLPTALYYGYLLKQIQLGFC